MIITMGFILFAQILFIIILDLSYNGISCMISCAVITIHYFFIGRKFYLSIFVFLSNLYYSTLSSCTSLSLHHSILRFPLQNKEDILLGHFCLFFFGSYFSHSPFFTSYSLSIDFFPSVKNYGEMVFFCFELFWDEITVNIFYAWLLLLPDLTHPKFNFNILVDFH